jgi:hypothetical protein
MRSRRRSASSPEVRPLQRPDYHGGSLVNLIATLSAACGARPPHETLTLLPPERIGRAANVVFFLVDGLGYNYLRDAGRGGALAEHLAGSITSVFPSTTATAITSTFTGLMPQAHAMTGWFCWFPESDVIAAPLPFRRRGDDCALTELAIEPRTLYAFPPLLDALAVRTFVVSQDRIVDSEYSRHFGGRAKRLGYENLAGLVDAVVTAVRSGAERKYVYAYYPELDTVAHRHGIASAQASARLAAIDAAFADLLKRLAGTNSAIIVSADHGFIDTPASDALELEHYAALGELLRQPLSGEPRVAYCHTKPGCGQRFAERAREILGSRADVRMSAELIAEGWFGPGAVHPRLAERVGNVTLIMRGHHTIKDHVPGEKRHLLIGNHGGLTEDEMLIPLVVAQA